MPWVRHSFVVMKPILSAIYSWLTFRLRSRATLELEIIALRHQIMVLRRNRRRRYNNKTIFQDADRMLWAWLYRILPRSKHFMILLQPVNVVRWHQWGYCFYWRLKSGIGGRPKLDKDLISLIRQMSEANPLWGGKRIHGELRKLGIKVHWRTVNKYMRRNQRCPPSPGWKVFIRTEMRDTVAIDMFIVVAATFRLLYGLVILGHDRRKILHFAVTEKPNQDWLADHLSLAFRSTPPPRFLVRDRDALYGKRFCERVQAMGIQEVVTGKEAWWQNVYVERVIGSIRRECIDHLIVRNERHLQGILDAYLQYYNKSRTHYSLDEDCPEPRPVEPPSAGSNIVAIPEVGGLHHRYTRRAA